MSSNAVTPAGSTDVALQGAALSIRQYKAARMLSIGYSQQQAADAAQVDIRTVQRWCDLADFDNLLQHLEAATWNRIGNRVAGLVEHALDIHFAMMRGEVKADDPVYLECKDIILRYVGRLPILEVAQRGPDYQDPAGEPVDPANAIETTFVARR